MRSPFATTPRTGTQPDSLDPQRALLGVAALLGLLIFLSAPFAVDVAWLARHARG